MQQPCDEGVVLYGKPASPCGPQAQAWILAATILASSMAFIDSTVVNVALPALQSSLQATVVGVQWVVESYGLFLSALILREVRFRQESKFSTWLIQFIQSSLADARCVGAWLR